jgi:hypothetical protein
LVCGEGQCQDLQPTFGVAPPCVAGVVGALEPADVGVVGVAGAVGPVEGVVEGVGEPPGDEDGSEPEPVTDPGAPDPDDGTLGPVLGPPLAPVLGVVAVEGPDPLGVGEPGCCEPLLPPGPPLPGDCLSGVSGELLWPSLFEKTLPFWPGTPPSRARV